jgi:DNA-binding NtrC family response regulator
MDLLGQSVAVLVVEDEPLVRMCVAATIEDAGFKVYEAANADEAVGLLAECADICVLFTDVDMPGSMNGVALAHYAHSYRPIKIIVTSGHRKIAAKDLPPKAIFMEKPYRPDHVVETLRAIAA